MKGGYIYILSNKNRTVLYTGVTSNISARIYEHKFERGSVFTSKYNCHDLLFYQFFETIGEAIDEEKKVKKWKRSWKLDLIQKMNPSRVDLYDQIIDLV